jgi:hypothetical protein
MTEMIATATTKMVAYSFLLFALYVLFISDTPFLVMSYEL